MLLNLFFLLILAACIGLLYTEGMWSNAIRLVNVVTAALLATNFWEPVAAWLDNWQPSYTYFWDFLALWGLFAALMGVLRLATDLTSLVKVRFLRLADRIGSAVFAVLIGWVMICFTAMTLHTAPLAREPFGGSFQPEARMFLGLAPDRQWLAFAQRASLGQFCREQSREDRQKKLYGVRENDPKDQENLCVFDRNGEFLLKYATRRANLKAHVDSTGSLRVRPSGR
jgi:uncharacterized membrane protein required for colicin V production